MAARELSAEEKAVIEFLLTRSFPGRDELRDQLVTARVMGSSCQCGCPSIALWVDGSMARAPVAASVDALGHDAAGNLVLVGLLTHDGYMSELDFTDIAGTSGGAPGFPTLESLRHADGQP